jgi:hypothetical protein
VQTAFLILLFAGTTSLIGGMLWTRLHWRADVPPYRRRGTSALDVTFHPERYANPEAVPLIRGLFVTGAILVGSAVLIVGYLILEITFGR